MTVTKAHGYEVLDVLNHVGDAFGGYESTRQCFAVAELAPSLLFDTSLSYNYRLHLDGT